MSQAAPEPGQPPQTAASHPTLVPTILVVATGLIYPLVFSFTKIATDAGAPPFGFVFWHLVVAGAALGVVALVRRELPRLSWPHLRSYVVIGILGIAAPISLLAFLASKLPAGLVTLVVVLSPLFTYLLAILFRLDRIRGLSVAGIALGLGGVLLVTVPEVSLPTPEMVGWLLLAFLAPVFFAMTNVSASLLRPPAASSVAMAAGMVLATTAIMAVVALASGQAYALPGPALWPVLATAALNAAFYVSFFEIVRMAGPVFFSQFNYLVVLAGFGWGALLFGERHHYFIWIGAVLMLLGLALHTISLNRAARCRRAGG
ncbi:MAG: DMT family transporter [Alphaproteobacteria bacterium]